MGSTKLILIFIQENNGHKGAMSTFVFVLITQFALELEF